MARLRYKDLVIDTTAHHHAAVVDFWSVTLGQDRALDTDGEVLLGPPPGGPPERRVWFEVVPEPLVGKSRVHLDLRVPGGDPAPLLAAGATVVRPPTDDDPWWVLADPGGVALCVFPPHPQAPDALGPFEVVVDSTDPEPIAAWWAARTGATVGRADGVPFVWLEGADGFPLRYWVFHAVPEAKTTKNRVHWDMTLVEGTLDDLQGDGATLLAPPREGVRWAVFADPQGNEFCVFPPEG